MRERIDKDIIRYLARQISAMKGLDNRREAIKKIVAAQGSNRVVFELALKAEIDRLWIGRRA